MSGGIFRSRPRAKASRAFSASDYEQRRWLPATRHRPLRNRGALDANGHDSLVVASNVALLPPGVITVTSDPKLGPLQSNGGPTPTHQLMIDSPAHNIGNNDAGSTLEQRGAEYPRTGGGSVDMGAVQFDTIFVDAFGS